MYPNGLSYTQIGYCSKIATNSNPLGVHLAIVAPKIHFLISGRIQRPMVHSRHLYLEVRFKNNVLTIHRGVGRAVSQKNFCLNADCVKMFIQTG